MPIVIGIAAGLILWFLHRIRPVPNLSYLEVQELQTKTNQCPEMKMLDVRDASDFQEIHIPCSVNISLGRLPYMWRKALSSEQSVIIVSSKKHHTKKAARILRKQGFQNLYAVRENLFKRSSAWVEGFKADCPNGRGVSFYYAKE